MCLTNLAILRSFNFEIYWVQLEHLTWLWHYRIQLAGQKKKKSQMIQNIGIGMRLSLCDIFVKDIRHYFSIEAEQGMEHASSEGSQVDRVGQPGKTADDTSTETQQTVKYVDLVRNVHTVLFVKTFGTWSCGGTVWRCFWPARGKANHKLSPRSLPTWLLSAGWHLHSGLEKTVSSNTELVGEDTW